MLFWGKENGWFHTYSWIFPCSNSFRVFFLSLGESREENSATCTPPNSFTSTYSLPNTQHININTHWQITTHILIPDNERNNNNSSNIIIYSCSAHFTHQQWHTWWDLNRQPLNLEGNALPQRYPVLIPRFTNLWAASLELVKHRIGLNFKRNRKWRRRRGFLFSVHGT